MRCCFCAAERDGVAHTASTSWRVCIDIERRCSIADFGTPATCQQGSRRFVPPVLPREPGTVLPGIPKPPVAPGLRAGGIPTPERLACLVFEVDSVVEVCADAKENIIPAPRTA